MFMYLDHGNAFLLAKGLYTHRGICYSKHISADNIDAERTALSSVYRVTSCQGVCRKSPCEASERDLTLWRLLCFWNRSLSRNSPTCFESSFESLHSFSAENGYEAGKT